jgi:flagellar basal-body rod modification protein FlgD
MQQFQRPGGKQQAGRNRNTEAGMATAAAGIWNQTHAAAQTLASAKATPMAGTAASGSTGTTSNSDSSSDSATISANDFLTLLVTEMQNQDPTAATDPNEYINQLVNVNSLEQLISINQNLSTALGSSTTNTTGASGANTAGKSASGAVPQVAGTGSHGKVVAGVQSAAAGATAGTKIASGNLSVPEATPAAHRVAGALGGRPHTRSAPVGTF